MRERALRLLLERLEEMEVSRMNALRSGAIDTFEKYREHVGFLQAIDQIRTECGEVEKRIHAPDERP